MAKKKRECGCPPELWRCHHELAEVKKKAAAELTSTEVAAAKQRMNSMLRRRPEEKRGVPLPREIRVVQGGAPGNGKRS
jgi:hypothetical protein